MFHIKTKLGESSIHGVGLFADEDVSEGDVVYVANLSVDLVLSDDELKYVNAVAEGELHLEYLFPDNLSEAKRLANHPALLWKIHNVQQEKNKP